MSVKRRRFLGFTIGAAAGTAVGGTASRAFIGLLSQADSSLFPPKGPESFTLSVCALCPGGCGLRVRRIGERVVKLEGNPLHPVNGGRLCPRGQAALQFLYHPDRAPGPLRRVGPRGSLASFVPVSWEDALGEIGRRLRALREARRPEGLALLRGPSAGIGARLARRLVQAIGSPNDIALGTGEETATMALGLSMGGKTAPAFDLAAADYVLSLGSALLEAWSAPVHTMRAYGEFRQGRTGRRGKLLHAEPRLSLTGASADEWIAVRPGTEGTLALGIAGVLVSEGLYNKDFVVERTRGFEELRGLLEKSYPLERVAAETGIAVNTVLRIAREFAAARRGLAVGPQKGPLLPGSLFAHLAAQVLNALVGNIDGPGGVLVAEEPPLAPWPALPSDPVAARGRAQARVDGAGSHDSPLLTSDPVRLAEAILSGSPYPIEVLFLLGADPLFASPAPARFASALERVGLVVSFAAIPDDSALHADFILPEAHFLERWDLHQAPAGVAFPSVSLAAPALAKPLHDVRGVAEIVLDLAKRTGPEVAAAFPWTDVPALLRADMDGLYQARRGALMGTPFDEAWVRMMEGAGWWAPGYRSAEELWKKALECGGWWDPFYDHGDWSRVLRTASGRFEFRADVLARASEAKPAGGGAPSGAFVLQLFEPLAIAGGTGAELPFLQGLLDPGLEERWETWVEINPESATALGLRDRDFVRVQSGQGALTVRARLTPRVVPGVVAIPVGLGKRGGGRWARGTGANPLLLLAPTRDAESGLPDLAATSVELTRVSGPEQARERRA